MQKTMAPSSWGAGDIYAARDRLEDLRAATAALSFSNDTIAAAAAEDATWLTLAPPLPAHARKVQRIRASMLSHALRGLRVSRLSRAMQRWAIGAAVITATETLQATAAPPRHASPLRQRASEGARLLLNFYKSSKQDAMTQTPEVVPTAAASTTTTTLLEGTSLLLSTPNTTPREAQQV